MTGPRIVFLPDYGPAIGGGHVMRSLTLASALADRGARCVFAVGELAAQRIKAFTAAPVELWSPDPSDWPGAAAVTVLDNYAAGVDDERALARLGARVAVLDDIGRDHDCDLVIDPGFGRSAGDYPGRARVLAGPAYALVRPRFTEVDRAAEPGRVLVSLGLTDVAGITAQVIARLMTLGGWSAIDVVLGADAESLDDVREVAVHDPRVSLHVDARDMAGLTARAEFAIGAGGSSVWERACLALPSLLVVLADNQATMAKALADAGAVVTADARKPGFDDAFRAGFAALAADPAFRDRLGEASHGLCDGRGAGRAADAILALCRESGAFGG